MNKDEIVRIGVKRLSDAYDADLDNRDRAHNDLRFVVGDQWPEDVRRAREADGKPCITINGLPQYLRQVTGQVRGLNPAIKVSAGDGDAKPDVAEIYEGIIRQIEAKCDAQSVYEAAAEAAAAGGIGFWRVRTDYCDDMTFDQEILIERVHNPFSVFIDPLAKDPTRKDMRYAFIVEEMDREDFRVEYPNATEVDATSDHRPVGLERWATPDTVTLAEYYWIEHETYKIGMAEDGQVIKDPKPPMMFVKEREVKAPRVKWVKMTGAEVLEGPVDVPCRYIPVFAVTGEEIHIGEEVYRSSVVRFAKDPAMLYNYARSANAEMVSLQPKAPYIGTTKQFSGLETIWSQANESNRPYLPYNPDEKAPPPQRAQPPVSSQGLMTEVQLAAEDMKRTTGIYDASLGAKSNETSGVAIDARKEESQNATSVYADNMVKSVAHCGCVIVDMIPKIYDTQRVVQILGTDETEKMVMINALMQTQDGYMTANDVRVGKYDVRVSVGPAYSTRRQEASEGMMEFLRVVPQAGAVTADLVAGAQEWPDADKFAERLKKTLPPGIVDEDDMPPEQQQAMMMQAQQEQAMAQRQQQLADAVAQAQAREEVAKAEKAEADAMRAKYEAEEARVKLAMMVSQPVPQAGFITT